MINISWSYKVDIVAYIVRIVVILDHISTNSLHILDISQNRQTYLLLLKDSPVRYFNSSFQRHRLPSFNELSVNSTPLVFNILRSVQRICQHITQNSYCLRKILLKGSHHIRCILTTCIGIQISPHIFDLELQTFSCSVFCALKVQMFEEMSNTTGLFSLVSTSTFDEDRNTKLFESHTWLFLIP